MKNTLLRVGFWILFLAGCQPHNNQQLSVSSNSFKDTLTTYQIDTSGRQVRKTLLLSFTCLLNNSTATKRTDLAYYIEQTTSINPGSYLEVREVTKTSGQNSEYSYKEVLIVDNLALSNLSTISLFVANDSVLRGTQTTITALGSIGSPFLQFNRNTGVGIFSAMGANGTPENMTCQSIRVP